MTKTDTTMWLPNQITLPDEHRIFQATDYGIKRSLPRALSTAKRIGECGAWAIADNSGDTPDTTDDGILWLNFDKNILLGTTVAEHPAIPVIAPDGTTYSTVTDAATLLILMDMFRWTVNVGGNLYRTVRW